MIGDRASRLEDDRLLRGLGRYTADLSLPDTLHIALLRSPYAHAAIGRIDCSRALALPGVVAAYDGRAIQELCSSPMRIGLPIPGTQTTEWYPLAVGRARFVGDPVVAVVAESRAIAEDAVDLIDVDFSPLPAVLDVEAALADDAPRVIVDWPTNELLRAQFANGDPEAAIAGAPRVLRRRITHERVSGVPIEGHAAIATYDHGSQHLRVIASNQWAHHLQAAIAEVCGLPFTNVHVAVPDMGGGFGTKQAVLREEMLVAVIAVASERPVQWVQDRSEGLTASVHAHDAVHDVTVGYDEDGRVVGLQVTLLCDLGVPTLDVHTVGPHLVTTAFLTGAYDIQDFSYDLRAVATNKCTSGGYRGYGQPEAHYTIERIIEEIAADLDLDPVEVRNRNLIPDSPRPYLSAVGSLYDVGSVRSQFERLVRELDYDGWRRRQVEARAQGRYIGIAVSSLIEAAGPDPFGLSGKFGPYEVASVSVYPDGSVKVAVGTKSQGQGHETVYAQCAASVLGTRIDNVSVTDGDTSLLPHGTGTWGSRSAVMGGGAVLKAARPLGEKCRTIAAILLGCDRDAVTVDERGFTADGHTISLADVARTAWWQTFLLPPDLDPGLVNVAVYDTKRTMPIPNERGHMNMCATYGTGATGVVVEVDPNTGHVEVLDAVIVHDCGTVINPTLLEGQLQGGFVQGVGMALLEEVLYDQEGQPVTSTLLDYRIPSMGDAPRLRIIHEETASEIEGGFRGAGEATIICGSVVVANAVADAIKHVGAVVTSSSLSSHRVRKALRDAGVGVDLARVLTAL